MLCVFRTMCAHDDARLTSARREERSKTPVRIFHFPGEKKLKKRRLRSVNKYNINVESRTSIRHSCYVDNNNNNNITIFIIVCKNNNNIIQLRAHIIPIGGL